MQAYVRGKPAPIVLNLSSHHGSWVVLSFYPGDFTVICPTELAAFARRHDEFLGEDAVVLAASTNSCFSHKAWFETDPRLAEVRYPVIADSLRELRRSFGVLLEDGAAQRGTFIIDSLGERAERVSFAAGETIVAEGGLADRFYVIARGEAAISRRSPEGDEIKLAKLGRGQLFGEVGILDETRRTATVRAVGDVELIALSWQEFQQALERSDRADRAFSEIANERIALAQ
jgi:peroxiredoxin